MPLSFHHAPPLEFTRFCKGIWRNLRAVSGDDAYDRYVERRGQCARHGEEPIMTRREFYDAELRRRWEGVRRCC